MKRNIKYLRQKKCDIVGGEVVALLMIAVVASLMSAPQAVRQDYTILAWLPYAVLIVGRSVFGAMCSQLKFTRSVKLNCE